MFILIGKVAACVTPILAVIVTVPSATLRSLARGSLKETLANPSAESTKLLSATLAVPITTSMSYRGLAIPVRLTPVMLSDPVTSSAPMKNSPFSLKSMDIGAGLKTLNDLRVSGITGESALI